jgi:hypothetical protein
MNKRRLTALAFAAALMAPVSTSAMLTPYMGASYGIGDAYFNKGLKDHDYNSLGVQAGIGIPFVRAEVEYARMFDSDVALGVGAVNFYLEPFLFIPVIKPYAGLGFGRVFDAKVEGVKFRGGNLFQGMIGTGLSIPSIPVRLDAEVRTILAGTKSPKNDPTYTEGFTMFTVGLHFKASYTF